MSKVVAIPWSSASRFLHHYPVPEGRGSQGSTLYMACHSLTAVARDHAPWTEVGNGHLAPEHLQHQQAAQEKPRHQWVGLLSRMTGWSALFLQGEASTCWRLTVRILEARGLGWADLCE